LEVDVGIGENCIAFFEGGDDCGLCTKA
jgi:hypothetical protein